MTASVQEKNQNTQEIKNERFLIWTRQINVHIFGIVIMLPLAKRQTTIHVYIYNSYYVAFSKATDDHTCIQHDEAETLSSMSLSVDRVEMLLPSRQNPVPNLSFAREPH